MLRRGRCASPPWLMLCVAADACLGDVLHAAECLVCAEGDAELVEGGHSPLDGGRLLAVEEGGLHSGAAGRVGQEIPAGGGVVRDVRVVQVGAAHGLELSDIGVAGPEDLVADGLAELGGVVDVGRLGLEPGGDEDDCGLASDAAASLVLDAAEGGHRVAEVLEGEGAGRDQVPVGRGEEARVVQELLPEDLVERDGRVLPQEGGDLREGVEVVVDDVLQGEGEGLAVEVCLVGALRVRQGAVLELSAVGDLLEVSAADELVGLDGAEVLDADDLGDLAPGLVDGEEALVEAAVDDAAKDAAHVDRGRGGCLDDVADVAHGDLVARVGARLLRGADEELLDADAVAELPVCGLDCLLAAVGDDVLLGDAGGLHDGGADGLGVLGGGRLVVVDHDGGRGGGRLDGLQDFPRGLVAAPVLLDGLRLDFRVAGGEADDVGDAGFLRGLDGLLLGVGHARCRRCDGGSGAGGGVFWHFSGSLLWFRVGVVGGKRSLDGEGCVLVGADGADADLLEGVVLADEGGSLHLAAVALGGFALLEVGRLPRRGADGELPGDLRAALGKVATAFGGCVDDARNLQTAVHDLGLAFADAGVDVVPVVDHQGDLRAELHRRKVDVYGVGFPGLPDFASGICDARELLQRRALFAVGGQDHLRRELDCLAVTHFPCPCCRCRCRCRCSVMDTGP